MHDPGEAAQGDVELSDVELKLFRLARAARARAEAEEGAAVVDETGRTYSAADVSLPHLELSAVQLAAATAAAAGARALHGSVVVGSKPALAAADVAVLQDLAASGAVVLRCAADQRVLARQVL